MGVTVSCCLYLRHPLQRWVHRARPMERGSGMGGGSVGCMEGGWIQWEVRSRGNGCLQANRWNAIEGTHCWPGISLQCLVSTKNNYTTLKHYYERLWWAVRFSANPYPFVHSNQCIGPILIQTEHVVCSTWVVFLHLHIFFQLHL